MPTIETQKEVIVFAQLNEAATALKLQDSKILFSEEVIVTGTNEKAELVIVQKDDPEKLIDSRVTSSTPPSSRAFIHTVCRNFVQGQTFYAAIVKQRTEEAIEFTPCIVLEIVPIGYIN